jgi:hypothetical protein
MRLLMDGGPDQLTASRSSSRAPYSGSGVAVSNSDLSLDRDQISRILDSAAASEAKRVLTNLTDLTTRPVS